MFECENCGAAVDHDASDMTWSTVDGQLDCVSGKPGEQPTWHRVAGFNAETGLPELVEL